MFILGLVGAASLAAERNLPLIEPAEAGMRAEKLAEIDRVVEKAIEEKKLPGCVVLVGRKAGIVWQKAYGRRQILPSEEAMTVDTQFDLASLTKPVATATSIMRLVDQGKLRVTDKVSTHWPEFTGHGKEELTLEHLLLHTSGLIADNPLRDYQNGEEQAWQRIAALKLQQPPGEKFVYSDVNFLVLGKVVEQVSDEPLDEFTKSQIFGPLNMRNTGYVRLPKKQAEASPENNEATAAATDTGSAKPPIAPTEKRNGEWMRGEVHDPRAYELQGVAGHAGVFSTADDLARYATAMLQRGTLDDETLLSESVWQLMTAPHEVPRGLRAYGWDVRSGFSSNRGRGMSSAAFGHGGFTGTAIWIDPQLDLYFVFLSNRVHPDGKGSVNPLAGEIGTIAVDALVERTDDEAATK